MADPSLAPISEYRGFSAPVIFGYDEQSRAALGQVIVHSVQVGTLVYRLGEVTPPARTGQGLGSLIDDRRFNFLAEALGPPELARQVRVLLAILGQSDPTPGVNRNPEYPIKIHCADDLRPLLVHTIETLAQLAAHYPA